MPQNYKITICYFREHWAYRLYPTKWHDNAVASTDV